MREENTVAPGIRTVLSLIVGRLGVGAGMRASGSGCRVSVGASGRVHAKRVSGRGADQLIGVRFTSLVAIVCSIAVAQQWIPVVNVGDDQSVHDKVAILRLDNAVCDTVCEAGDNAWRDALLDTVFFSVDCYFPIRIFEMRIEREGNDMVSLDTFPRSDRYRWGFTYRDGVCNEADTPLVLLDTCLLITKEGGVVPGNEIEVFWRALDQPVQILGDDRVTLTFLQGDLTPIRSSRQGGTWRGPAGPVSSHTGALHHMTSEGVLFDLRGRAVNAIFTHSGTRSASGTQFLLVANRIRLLAR
jgi:hypothetical protein